TRQTSMRSALAAAATGLFPPSIRQSLVLDRSFCSEYGLVVDAKVSIGKGTLSLDRGTFFSTVRRALTKVGATETIQDVSGMEWSITATEGPDLPVVSVSRSGQSYSITNLF